MYLLRVVIDDLHGKIAVVHRNCSVVHPAFIVVEVLERVFVGIRTFSGISLNEQIIIVIDKLLLFIIIKNIIVIGKMSPFLAVCTDKANTVLSPRFERFLCAVAEIGKSLAVHRILDI